jgi:putative hydrolases of HD superfamily
MGGYMERVSAYKMLGLGLLLASTQVLAMDEKRDITPDQSCVDFVFEIGMLGNIPRAGNPFLGSGSQTIADHSFRCAAIGYLLSQLTTLSHDPYKLLCLCLFQDAHQARTGNLNYLQQQYISIDRDRVWADIENLSPIGSKIHAFNHELEEKKSNESLLAHDADLLELLFFLKEQHDLGSPRALEWFEYSENRLITAEAQSLAQELKERKADEWWKKTFSK